MGEADEESTKVLTEVLLTQNGTEFSPNDAGWTKVVIGACCPGSGAEGHMVKRAPFSAASTAPTQNGVANSDNDDEIPGKRKAVIRLQPASRVMHRKRDDPALLSFRSKVRSFDGGERSRNPPNNLALSSSFNQEISADDDSSSDRRPKPGRRKKKIQAERMNRDSGTCGHASFQGDELADQSRDRSSDQSEAQSSVAKPIESRDLSEGAIQSPAGSTRDSGLPSDDDDTEDEEEAEGERTFMSKKYGQTYKIVRELLTTEQTYVERLGMIMKFKQGLEAAKSKRPGFIDDATMNVLFSNSDSIYEFHSKYFLPPIQERVKNWEKKQAVGDILKPLVNFLKLYTVYIKDFNDSNQILMEWTKKSELFRDIVKDIEKACCSGMLTMSHHMLGPVQRIPRYELLLKDYLKHLPRDHPDYPESSETLEKVCEAAKHNNDEMKKIEDFRKVLEIQESLVDLREPLVSPSRQFLHTGRVDKLSRRGEPQERFLFLFTDILLICAKNLARGFAVRDQLDVSGMEVSQRLVKARDDSEAVRRRTERGAEDDDDEDEDDEDELRAAGGGDAFVLEIKAKQKALMLLCETGEDLEKWMEVLRSATEAEKKKKETRQQKLANVAEPAEAGDVGQRAPKWVKDSEVSLCMNTDCLVEFSAFRRRHHCRACGKVYCRYCVPFKAQLAFAGDKEQQICKLCYTILSTRYGHNSTEENGNHYESSSQPNGFNPHQQNVNGCSSPHTPRKNRGKIIDAKLTVTAGEHSLVRGFLSLSKDNRVWDKRYVAVHEDFVLYVYGRPKDVAALHAIPLPGYQVSAVLDKALMPSKNEFKLEHPKGSGNCATYYCRPDAEHKLQKWINVLTKVCKAELPKEKQTL